MRKLCLVLCFAGFTFSSVYANGLFISPGARSGGLGNASTVGTNDSTAIYFNPASLAGLRGSDVELNMSYIKGAVKSNHSLKNTLMPDSDNGEFPFPAVYNMPSIGLGVDFEPSEYGNRETNTLCILPFTAGYTRIDDITVALGFYVAGGGSGKWENTVQDAVGGADTIHGLMDGSFGFIIYNVSAAKEISEGVSLGLGVNLVSMQSKTTVNKEYTKSANSMLPAVLGSYAFHLESNASGSGIEGVMGITCKLSEKSKAGLVFRSGTNIALKGTSRYTQTGLGALGAAYADASLQSDYDQSYAYPVTMAVGTQYQATDKVLAVFSIDRNSYSSLKNDLTYKTPVPGIFNNVNQSRKWDDTYRVHAGAEYKVDEKLSLRGGIQNDPLPFTRSKASLTNTNQFNLIMLSLGAGHSLGPVHLDWTYIRTISDKFDNAERSYEYPSDAFQIGINYKFGKI